jgi:outer membrane receptor protein involved in Fe transport
LIHTGNIRLVFSLVFLCAVIPTLAGPPLHTEDPGILDQGQWEIISAVTATSVDSGNSYQAPLLDVSLGIIADQVQIAVTYPYIYTDPDDESSESDFGNLELGIKWRFWNSDKLQIAFAPGYTFGVNRKTLEHGIGDGDHVALFQLAAEYQINDRWRLNTAAGYASVRGGDDKWDYGSALAYGLNGRWELLFELTGTTDTDFDDDALNIRAGFDLTLTDDVHLLFSAATGLREPDGTEALDYDLYFGIQFFY